MQIMKKSIFFLVMFFFFFYQSMFSQSGLITGKVFDAKTRESLSGVNIIIIELPNLGAATDINGQFKIKAPVGSYSLKASLIGYSSVIKTDVIARSGAETYINIPIHQATLELNEVKVIADYFDKTLIENDISSLIIGAEEIRRSPGSSQDFQRVIQAMPGVSFSNDQNNELLVRGGAPDENLTIFDNIEIHSTNHYPNSMNSGGPINMINVDLIQDVKFSTGGFISKYGDKLSSTLTVVTREGTRIRDIGFNANLSMAGFGAILEGQIDKGKGSWLFSARKSYIDLISKGFGLTAIPYYYDAQFKLCYDFSAKQKLALSGIYGDDKIFIEGEFDAENIVRANLIDSVDVEVIDVKQRQYAVGLTFKSLWSKEFYSLVTFSNNKFYDNIDVSLRYSQRVFDSMGKTIRQTSLNERKLFNRDETRSENALKAESVWNFASIAELNFGGSIKFIDLNSVQSMDADTVRYDIDNDGIFDNMVVLPASKIKYYFAPFGHNKLAAYINGKIKLFEQKFVANLGIRYDCFSYSEKYNISPRISAGYYVIPNLTSLNFAYGEYYQTPSLPYFSDRYQSEINRYLLNSRARHFVLGVEHILDEGLKVNLEGYVKNYYNLPVRETFIYSFDRTFRSEKYLCAGKKKVYGIDFLIQQKLVKSIYGTLSVSRMWGEFEDLRIGMEGKTFDDEYIFPYVITIIAGKRFSNLRSKLNESPFYCKYPSFILPFSDDMEISARWRFASGKSYTERIFTHSEQHRQGAAKWSEGWWIESEKVNGKRFPDYHRLDISFNSRYNFETWSLSLYLSIQNLYNRKNIAMHIYNSDGTVDNVYQFSFMPIAGIEIQF